MVFEQIWQQLDLSVDIEEQELQPVDLSLPALQELGAKWLVEMAEYMSNNPSFIVRGLGISKALDGNESEDETDSDYSESSEDSSDEDTSEVDTSGDSEDEDTSEGEVVRDSVIVVSSSDEEM